MIRGKHVIEEITQAKKEVEKASRETQTVFERIVVKLFGVVVKLFEVGFKLLLDVRSNLVRVMKKLGIPLSEDRKSEQTTSKDAADDKNPDITASDNVEENRG